MEVTLSKVRFNYNFFFSILLCMYKYSKYNFIPHHVNFYEIKKIVFYPYNYLWQIDKHMPLTT